LATVQVNLAHAFNLRVTVGKQTVVFPLKRGLNWVDESLKDTPEWKALITKIELPIEAVQAQLVDPVRGLSGGVPVNADAAVAQAKQNAERAVAENKEHERRKKEEEERAKEEAHSLLNIDEETGKVKKRGAR
jgi:hypothetical protein